MRKRILLAALLAGTAMFSTLGISDASAHGGSPIIVHSGGGGFNGGGGGGFHPTPVHVPAPVHVPVHVPVHTPPVHTPPVHTPPVHTPPTPVHPGHGPISVHPGGSQVGIGTHTHGPTVFRGGNPHTPFVAIHVQPHYRAPVLVVGGYSGRWHPLPHFGYCNGFYWGGALYVGPDPFFFGYGDWAPTEWIFESDVGTWWSPGLGYVAGPPVGYNDVITVGVKETQPVLDATGNPVLDANGNPVTEQITVYYNAYFDPIYGAYGYLNHAGKYVWLRW